MWKMLFASGLCLCVGACASAGSRNARVNGVTGNDVDVEKIDKVTQWAHDHGAKLIWLRYPLKPNPRPTPTPGS